MNDLTHVITGFLAVLVGGYLGWQLRAGIYRDHVLTGSPTPSSAPQIVVNVPPDWKPLETMPPTAIEGAKATLYWTVYRTTLEATQGSSYASSSDIEDARNAAQAAVEAVFTS